MPSAPSSENSQTLFPLRLRALAGEISLDFYRAVKHFFRAARHINPVIVVAPFDEKIAAFQMNRDLAIGSNANHSGNSYGARARAARPGFTRAPFPNSHFDFVATENFNELGINALREKMVMLKFWPELFEIQSIDVIQVHDTMGIAHR